MPAYEGNFLEGAQIVAAIPPVNLATAANNGQWVNMRNFGRLVVIVAAGTGTAGSDLTVSLRQATDNAGTGAKALTFTTVQKKLGAQSGIGQFTRQTQAAAGSFTETNAASQLLYAIEIRAAQLDEGFTHVQVQIPQVGAAKVGCALVLGLEPRHKVGTSLSAID